MPAAGLRILTPLYDVAVRVGMREHRMRDALQGDAALAPGMRVLDLACGTGSFAILVKRQVPSCEVVGVDIDEQVLELARRKAQSAGVELQLERRAVTDELGDLGPFDRVFTSLVMHHLDPVSRVRALRRVHAALRVGGRVHIADFGPPSSRRMRLAFYAIQLLDGFETTSDCVRGTIPDHLRDAEFESIREIRKLDTAFGTVRFWSGERAR